MSRRLLRTFACLMFIAFLFALPSTSSAAEGWTRKADIPLTGGSLGSGVVNGKIYVIGSHVQIYDPATDTWSVGAETPTRRRTSVSVVDGKIYAIEPTRTLTWNPGYLTASHEVYFGTDAEAVKNATKGSPEYKGIKAVGDEDYDPGLLALEATYYWRIDEVNSLNADSPWLGNVWSFTTGDYFVVDDFETYNDIDPPDTASNIIFDNWIDGFATTGNGALVGNDLPPYAEQDIVHSGTQSMVYRYNNNLKASEATLMLTTVRDWTEDGVGVLSLCFRGYSPYPSLMRFFPSPVGPQGSPTRPA
ncbi:MAG: hypothetical protein ACYTE3_01245 [Planctomycetota bacterium]